MNNQLAVRNNNGLALSPKIEQALEKLEPKEQKLISLALGRKINEIEPANVVTEFVATITTAYAIAGQQANQETLFLYADEFYTRLCEQYPGTTIDEVKQAIKNGVYGDYGEYFGLNPKTFMQFVKAYRCNNDRLKAINNFEDARALLAYEKVLTPAEKEQSKKEFTNTLFADFLAGKLITDFIPGFIYDYLEAQEIIRLTFEEKRVINEKAKAYYLRLSSSPKMKDSIAEQTKGLSYTLDPEKSVKTISKQFAVYEYFEKMQQANQTVIFEF